MSLTSEKPHVTFITTSKLKEAFNQSKKRANQKATLQPHKAQLNDLQSTHRDPTTNRSFLPGFATPKEPSLVSTFEDASTQTDVPALREDNEPVNNGPSDAEFFADTEQAYTNGEEIARGCFDLSGDTILHKEVTVQSKKDQSRKISIVAESVEINMPHQSGSHFTEI
jgi:hypothetical protein